MGLEDPADEAEDSSSDVFSVILPLPGCFEMSVLFPSPDPCRVSLSSLRAAGLSVPGKALACFWFISGLVQKPSVPGLS